MRLQVAAGGAGSGPVLTCCPRLRIFQPFLRGLTPGFRARDPRTGALPAREAHQPPGEEGGVGTGVAGGLCPVGT